LKISREVLIGMWLLLSLVGYSSQFLISPVFCVPCPESRLWRDRRVCSAF